MRHPKSTSHNLRDVVAFGGIGAFATCALLVSCAPLPGRDMVGTGGTSAAGTTGTGNAAGTSGTAGIGGSAAAGRGGATGVGGVGNSVGTGGVATGTGGSAAAGIGGTGNVAGRGGAGATGGSASTGGSAGSAGATGTGGTGGTSPPRGPTPAANGVNFPFPQNREISRCAYPVNYLNSDVMAAWTQFKADTVVSAGNNSKGMPMRRIQRTASDPVSTYTPAMSTVSEGIAYGMLVAV